MTPREHRRRAIVLWANDARTYARQLQHDFSVECGEWTYAAGWLRGTLRCGLCAALGGVDSKDDPYFYGPLFEAPCVQYLRRCVSTS